MGIADSSVSVPVILSVLERWRGMGQNFVADFRNYARIVWPIEWPNLAWLTQVVQSPIESPNRTLRNRRPVSIFVSTKLQTFRRTELKILTKQPCWYCAGYNNDSTFIRLMFDDHWTAYQRSLSV